MTCRTSAVRLVLGTLQVGLIGGLLLAFEGPQFPPLGTGVSADEKVALQATVDQLAAKVAALKRKYPSGHMADRIADVEIYLDAVRRPLKYRGTVVRRPREHASRGRHSDALDRERTRRTVDERSGAVDGRERRPGILFED